MADLAPASPDLDPETADAAPTDPVAATPNDGDGNLLGELARAMHAAASSQSHRLDADLQRRRTEQVAAITDRASTESANLKADSEADIGAIDAWAKTETEKIKLERLRRIDARREQLAAQLGREETIKEREVFAIEVAIDAHRKEMELFFGRLERETDPSAIAQIASSMPAFPSLGDVAEQARRSAAAEFATIEGQPLPGTASGLTAITSATSEPADTTPAGAESIAEDGSDTAAAKGAATAVPAAEPPVDVAQPALDAAEPDLDAAEPAVDAAEPAMAATAEVETATAVSQSRLKAVMDPAASRGEGDPAKSWEAPYAVSVAAGSATAEDEPAPLSVGSTLLRTVRSIRPMASRHDKDSGEGDPGH